MNKALRICKNCKWYKEDVRSSIIETVNEGTFWHPKWIDKTRIEHISNLCCHPSLYDRIKGQQYTQNCEWMRREMHSTLYIPNLSGPCGQEGDLFEPIKTKR